MDPSGRVDARVQEYAIWLHGSELQSTTRDSISSEAVFKGAKMASRSF